MYVCSQVGRWYTYTCTYVPIARRRCVTLNPAFTRPRLHCISAPLSVCPRISSLHQPPTTTNSTSHLPVASLALRLFLIRPTRSRSLLLLQMALDPSPTPSHHGTSRHTSPSTTPDSTPTTALQASKPSHPAILPQPHTLPCKEVSESPRHRGCSWVAYAYAAPSAARP